MLCFQQKESNWEGAIRTNAIIYAPFLANQGVIRNQLFHVSDWLPTLAKLGGFEIDSRIKLDGKNQWNMINYGGLSPRHEVMNVDDVMGYGSLIYFSMKFVNGSSSDGEYDNWLSSTNNNGYVDPITYALNVLNSTASRSIFSVQKKNLCVDTILKLRKFAQVKCTNGVNKNPCNLKKGPCLFNIYDDPCEENNLASTLPSIKASMQRRYEEKMQIVVPTRRKLPDPACDPINFDLNWNWWQEETLKF